MNAYYSFQKLSKAHAIKSEKHRQDSLSLQNYCLFLSILLLFSTSNFPLFSQNADSSYKEPDGRMDTRFGVFLGGNYNRARVSFYELFFLSGNKTPFTEGDGTGGNAGFLAEFPIVPWLNLGVRANVIQLSHTIRATPEFVRVGALDGNSDIAKFQRTMDAYLGSAGLQLILGITPIQNLSIYLGARANFYFFKQYRQIETILEPSYGRFDDGLPEGNFRTRNLQTGEIPIVRALGIANLNLALMGGIGYELPLNPAQSFTLAPEVFVARGLTDLVLWFDSREANSTWQIDNLQANLAFRWYPDRANRFNAEAYQLKRLQSLEKEIAQERRKIQTELRELRSSGLSVKISDMKGVLADGKTEIPNPTVRVEEFRTEKQHQILPFIFFNENSAVIPGRYRRFTANERTSFRPEALEKLRPVDVYYSLLNIVGKRMESNPAAVLFVTGCNSNSGTEQGNQRLSEQRAQAVSDYLQDVWKIAAKRIIVQKRDLPEKASASSSNLTQDEANVENRRVELSSTSPDILAPLQISTSLFTVNPPTLKFALGIFSGVGLKQWELDITSFEGREERTLHTFVGTNTFPEQYVWNIDADQRNIPTAGAAMDIRLGITDIDNRDAEAPIVSVPLDVKRLSDKKLLRLPDKVILSYTLGFFDNDADAEKILQSLKTRLNTQSSVGLDSYSGAARAAAMTQRLGVQNAQLLVSKDIQARNQNLLRNDPLLPEGRFFNRAVRIEVQQSAQ